MPPAPGAVSGVTGRRRIAGATPAGTHGATPSAGNGGTTATAFVELTTRGTGSCVPAGDPALTRGVVVFADLGTDAAGLAGGDAAAAAAPEVTTGLTTAVATTNVTARTTGPGPHAACTGGSGTTAASASASALAADALPVPGIAQPVVAVVSDTVPDGSTSAVAGGPPATALVAELTVATRVCAAAAVASSKKAWLRRRGLPSVLVALAASALDTPLAGSTPQRRRSCASKLAPQGNPGNPLSAAGRASNVRAASAVPPGAAASNASVVLLLPSAKASAAASAGFLASV